MKVKSYYAATVEAAMSSAAKEMGPDAVLITTRRSGIDAQHLGAYEVVFGTMTEASPEPAAAPSPRASSSNAVPTSDLDCLRAELAEMRRALVSACRTANSRHWMPELGHADSILTEAGIPTELKDDILGAIDGRLRDELSYDQARSATAFGRKSRFRSTESTYLDSEARILPLLREQFDALLEIAPQLSPKQGSRIVAALVGPSGCGKTATLIKLAIHCGLAARKSVLLVSTDCYRAGATEQLALCAAAIGIRFEIADSPLALGQILDENLQKQLILIDTPGASPADMDMTSDMARYLSRHPEVETHLLLPVTANPASLASAVKRFSCYAPQKAILTKMDEAENCGAALGHAILANLPVSFVTFGQQTPDDVAGADKDQLLSFLSAHKFNRAVSAA